MNVKEDLTAIPKFLHVTELVVFFGPGLSGQLLKADN